MKVIISARIKRASKSLFCMESSCIEVLFLPWYPLLSIARASSSASLITPLSKGIARAGIERRGFFTKSIPLAFWAAFVRSTLSNRRGRNAIEMFIIVASSKELIPSQRNGKGLSILSMPQVIADGSVLAVRRAPKSKSSINRAASLSPFSSPSRLGCRIQYEARALPSVKNSCVRKIKNIYPIL